MRRPRIYRLRGWWLETRILWSRYEKGWQDGYSEAMDEADEVVEAKDGFIAEQSALIADCMDVFDDLGAWDRVPERLRDRLASYA